MENKEYEAQIVELKAKNQQLQETIDKWFSKPPNPKPTIKKIENLLLKDLKGE